MLSVLANRKVYLVTFWKIYIYYIDTEYKWGILSGILWLCYKTNCHICLNSCFPIPILQSSSTSPFSETLLFSLFLLLQYRSLHFIFFLSFILWQIITEALQLALHSIKLRYCSCNMTEEQGSCSFLRQCQPNQSLLNTNRHKVYKYSEFSIYKMLSYEV